MNIFDLRFETKFDCDFIGDNESDLYLVKSKYIDDGGSERINITYLNTTELEEMLQGIEQLKKTIKNAIEHETF